MRSFKDAKGDSWEITVNLPNAARVSARTGINLMAIGNGDRHTLELLDVPHNSFAAIDALTETQRLARGISMDELGERLSSEEVVDAALQAIIGATFDFFHKGKAAVLEKSMQTYLKVKRELEAEELAKATAKVDSPEFEAKIRSELRRGNAADSQARSE